MSNNLFLGPLEQDVMDCVWKNKSSSVRDIYSCLKTTRKIAYTTVMTVMSRLTEKGYLDRKMVRNTYIYTPKIARKKTLKKTVAMLFDYLFDNFGEEAIASFVDELDRKGLSEEKRKELISKLKNEN